MVGPAAEAVPDVKRKLPGRGIWITATRASIEEAAKRNVFARGFKRDVRVARDLPRKRRQLIERAALDALAIAGKAGTVVSGFSRVEAAVGRDDILALIHAADASDDGKRKLDGRPPPQGNRKIAGNRGDRRVYRRPIGFGIEPTKCGTCSPACRAREARLFLRALRV